MAYFLASCVSITINDTTIQVPSVEIDITLDNDTTNDDQSITVADTITIEITAVGDPLALCVPAPPPALPTLEANN